MPAFRGHESVRKFHCEVSGCSASFVKRAHLRRHEMTHTQRRDFACPGCGRAFSRNDSMARHLRRKHPHLYRSQEATPATNTSSERLYTGSMSGPPAVTTNFAPTNGVNLMPLRTPYDHGTNEDMHRRRDDLRAMPETLVVPPEGPDMYSRDTNLPSPKGACSAQWRASGPSHIIDPSYSNTDVPRYDESRPFTGRYNQFTKTDPASTENSGIPSFYHSIEDSAGDPCPARRPPVPHGTSLYREGAVSYHADPNYGSNPAYRNDGTSAPVYRFPWERQEEGVTFGQPCGSMGWGGPAPMSDGATVQSSEHERRGMAGMPYSGINYAHTGETPNEASVAAMHQFAETSAEHESLQSEFFINPVRLDGTDVDWSSLDPCMLSSQPSERIRIESGPEQSFSRSDDVLVPPEMMGSPSGRSATAADTYFAVNFRGLCDATTSAEPLNAGQVEQIMAGLGLDLSSSQDASASVSQSLSSQPAFPQPDAPHIPSQGRMSIQWTADRHMFSNAGAGANLLAQSQAQSSQSSVYLPSLTASQSEYLGPHATSHRRPLDRAFSSASIAFDNGSQPRTSTRRSPSLEGQNDECNDKSSCSIGAHPESQELFTRDEMANFHKPHDFSLSHAAARDEEGGGKADHSVSQSTGLLTERGGRGLVVADEKLEKLAIDTQQSDRMAPPTCTGSGSNSMGPPRRSVKVSVASDDDVDMEAERQPLPQDAPQRNSSASTTTSAVSGDQLRLVVDRFRAFAQLCQDHMHPSTEMLDCLAPLIPKIIRSDAPFFHPKMIGSQKVHSPEEAFALLSLASLTSCDPNLKEEGHRLIYFLYGLVMLSYKHTLQLGGEVRSFLNCFLLVGMHSVRQATPDLYHKLEENRESILLDVLRAETRNHALDDDMDRIDADRVHALAEEDLFEFWSRWYEHESRKRTLLLCAIQDSQSSSYFSPFKIDLNSRATGPRCQFLFAHVYEPCPDTIFLAWPPKAWASRLANSISLPSSKGAAVAFSGNKPVSIASGLVESLLKPHVAQVQRPSTHPRFRSSFDFTAVNSAISGSKPERSSNASRDPTGRSGTSHLAETAHESGVSASSSRRPSYAVGQERSTGIAPRETRTVSQLYMLALLEAVNGAWMTDSGWYQTPAWGAAALQEQLAIDDEDFDIDEASIADLPGWRVGRTLHATQVTHALMNWSEMFSGWYEESRKDNEAAGASATKSGLRVVEDAHQSTVRWQAIFLGLCAPLQSLCYYLDSTRRSSEIEGERYRRISLLLFKWADSASCRRALVHAGTILTLLSAIKTRSSHEKLGPATSHAAYMAMVVLVAVTKLLSQTDLATRCAASGSRREELVAIRDAWGTLLTACKEENQDERMPSSAGATQGEGGTVDDQEWLQVRFWHRKFQYLGLAGIFRDQESSCEAYADWRASVSAGPEGASSVAALRAAHLRPRWSSFAGEKRWPTARRETIHVQQPSSADQRRASNAQLAPSQPDLERDLLRRRFRSAATSNNNPFTETRRWILQGPTRSATFCGLALWATKEAQETESGLTRQQKDRAEVLTEKHLRGLVMWIRSDDVSWCFSQEYTSLLHGVQQDPASADAGVAPASGK